MLSLPAPALSQAPESSDAVQVLPSEPMTREEWRVRILETRRRVQEENARRRTSAAKAVYPTTEELEAIATDRILSDSSLRFGDIVVTNRGKYIYRGNSENEPTAADFEKISGR